MAPDYRLYAPLGMCAKGATVQLLSIVHQWQRSLAPSIQGVTCLRAAGDRAPTSTRRLTGADMMVSLGPFGLPWRRHLQRQPEEIKGQFKQLRQQRAACPSLLSEHWDVLPISGATGHGASSGGLALGDKVHGRAMIGKGGTSGGAVVEEQRGTIATLRPGEAGAATAFGRKRSGDGTPTRTFRCGGDSRSCASNWIWDLQGRFEHVPEQVLGGSGYLEAVLGILDVIAGEKDATEKRRVVRAALFEGQRRKEETLSQFALRREQEFLGADRYLTIPSELKALLLEETAGLSRQGVQNLRTVTGGTVDFDKVVNALKMLNVEEEPLTRGKSSLFAGMAESEDPEGEGSESSSEDEVSLLLYEDEVESFLMSVDGVDEKEAVAMLAAWDKEQREEAGKRKTWKANKDRKQAAKKDRRVFTKKNRPRLSIADLKEVTKCANCGQRGHWKDECTNPYKAKDSKGATSGKRAVSFVYLGVNDDDGCESNFVAGAGWSQRPGRRQIVDLENPIHPADAADPKDNHEPFDPINRKNAVDPKDDDEPYDTISRKNAVDPEDKDEPYDTINQVSIVGEQAHDETYSPIRPKDGEATDLVHDLVSPIDNEVYDTIHRQDDEIAPGEDRKVNWRCDRLDPSLRALLRRKGGDSLHLVFLTLDPGHAILDIGAGQDLLGKDSYDRLCSRLREQGLQCIRLPGTPPATHGVGGQAHPLFQTLIPCILGGVPGVIRATVVKEDVGQLLSVGLLEEHRRADQRDHVPGAGRDRADASNEVWAPRSRHSQVGWWPISSAQPLEGRVPAPRRGVQCQTWRARPDCASIHVCPV